MKKLLLALLLAAGLIIPSIATATGEPKYGFYIAPKFVYSYQMMDALVAELPGLTMHLMDAANDSTYGGALAIGYDWKSRFDIPIRTEIECATRSELEAEHTDYYTSGPLTVFRTFKPKVQTSSIFFNAYWDIDFLCLNGKKSSFVPYVGGGIGISFMDWELDYTEGTTSYPIPNSHSTESRNRTNFAWNIGAGVAYKFANNWALDLGYRYVDFGDIGIEEDGGSMESKIDAHEVLFGIRYTF